MDGRHSIVEGDIKIIGPEPIQVQLSVFAGTVEVFSVSKLVDSINSIIPVSISGMDLDSFQGTLSVRINLEQEGFLPTPTSLTIPMETPIEQFPSFALDAIQIVKGIDIDGFEFREIFARIIGDNLEYLIPFETVNFEVHLRGQQLDCPDIL